MAHWPRLLLGARDSATRALGGPGSARIVLVLAAVLGLNGADTATISATTSNLEQAFGIGNTQMGLLLSVVRPARFSRCHSAC